jgi:hypothetical protein
LLVAGAEPNLAALDGWVTFNIERIADHEVVVLR